MRRYPIAQLHRLLAANPTLRGQHHYEGRKDTVAVLEIGKTTVSVLVLNGPDMGRIRSGCKPRDLYFHGA